MIDLVTLGVTVFMGFFAIMNPIANTAVFTGLTASQSAHEKKQTAIKALTAAFFIVAAFSLLGKGIFQLFGITLPALRMAGGILVFMVGYHMLQGSSSSMQTQSPSKEAEDVAISPLAIPILAGPGTIATAMNYSAAESLLHILITISAFGVLCLVTLLCFLYAQKLVAFLGKDGVNVITRIMGLLLTVIAMQMLIQGVHDAMHLFTPAGG
ncbi:MarC family protein [Photobacterium sp. WH77]|uniref:MarC family protein n=1 Tax=Photobacterium TaxID=657 RepID=UPI001EDC5EBF|nr:MULTISPECIES: MarC family protein [Photobacterium]MCG2835368.1 MarC family protein [Photobacterium sp. WH77]MCG2842981.1 MarC family protein [Photobacterium sp. WH80]